MKERIVSILLNILIAVIALTTVLTISLPMLKWNTMKATPMDIWLVDKTVPKTDYREHKGFTWVLSNSKIKNVKTGELFRFDQDYYGFFPENKDSYKVKEIPPGIEKPDLIYLADTYGVYRDDYFTGAKTEGERSQRLYGGLSGDEIQSIKSSLGMGNTVIAEFNTALSTSNETDRQQLREIFGVSWTGYSGRYFEDLSVGVEVPQWTVSDYEKSTGSSWSFKGPGVVIVSENGEVIVLRRGIDTGKKDVTVKYSKASEEEFGIKGEVPYGYWFEFTNADPSSEVLAQFSIDLTEKGKEVLSKFSLEGTFPAVIRSKNKEFNSYYFAGDFADNKAASGFWNFYGFAKFKSIVTFGGKSDNSAFFWKCYVPMMSKIIGDIKAHMTETANDKPELQYGFKTQKNKFQIQKDGKWEDFFAAGINVGSSVPGKWFSQFSDDEGMYLDWFSKIAAMNANSIRVYTLQSPQFYSALLAYNHDHPDKKLYFYQEIWPDEDVPEGNYIDRVYNNAYAAEIKNVLDALHGSANIGERKGRAFGLYKSDVSEYCAGIMVGRELLPDEVIATDTINKDFTFNGKYLFSSREASPTESWLAMCCDLVVSYETEKYSIQHPVGIVSWPTLDPKQHESEINAAQDKTLEYNDKAVIDINHIGVKDALKAGLFGAYHIYPNYPDFMNNEPAYLQYRDDEGIFRYGGYLSEFIKGHKKYPAMVAEFGLATGMGNAHYSPDGYNQGGLTEEQQGAGIVRMMKAIKKEGYAGGLIFEWSDEWAKSTWINKPYILPFERNPLWQNAVDPEQNYGILAMEAASKKGGGFSVKGSGMIDTVKMDVDESFLYIDVQLKREIDHKNEKLYIGLDTFDRSRGETRFSPDIAAKTLSGMEFEVEFTSADTARLLTVPSYNTAAGRYSPAASADGVFESIIRLTNSERITPNGKINALYQDESRLTFGAFENNTHNNWYTSDNVLHLRLPWTRLNFTDPSQMRVLDDKTENASPEPDTLSTAVSDGVIPCALVYDKKSGLASGTVSTLSAFKWRSWDEPAYKSRLKSGYDLIKDYLAQQSKLD